MAHIAGITIEKDSKGKAKYMRIDLRKYGQRLREFIKEVGLEDEISPYDPKFVAKIKQGEKEIAEGKTHKINLDDLWK